MCNMICCDMNEIIEHIYINNDVPCNYDMTDNDYNILKLECSKNIVLFVKQLKKINIIKQLIVHVEQSINIDYVKNINNLFQNYNITYINPIIDSGIAGAPIDPIAISPNPALITNTINTCNKSHVNKTYFSELINNTIMNAYNNTTENWTCPYQYINIASNIHHIKQLLINEQLNLNTCALTVRDFLSKYQKIHEYRNIINNILINL